MYLWVTGWLTTTGTQELRKLYYISTYNTMKPKYFRFLKFLHHSSFNKYIQLNKYGKKDTFCKKTPARTKQLKPWELVTTTLRQSLVAICSILLQPRLDDSTEWWKQATDPAQLLVLYCGAKIWQSYPTNPINRASHSKMKNLSWKSRGHKNSNAISKGVWPYCVRASTKCCCSSFILFKHDPSSAKLWAAELSCNHN